MAEATPTRNSSTMNRGIIMIRSRIQPTTIHRMSNSRTTMAILGWFLQVSFMHVWNTLYKLLSVFILVRQSKHTTGNVYHRSFCYDVAQGSVGFIYSNAPIVCEAQVRLSHGGCASGVCWNRCFRFGRYEACWVEEMY
jgi:hypothetical protein